MSQYVIRRKNFLPRLTSILWLGIDFRPLMVVGILPSHKCAVLWQSLEALSVGIRLRAVVHDRVDVVRTIAFYSPVLIYRLAFYVVEAAEFIFCSNFEVVAEVEDGKSG